MTATLSREQTRTLLELREDPVRFIGASTGESMYDKQTEVMRAVASRRRVSVVGCNGSGKDWASGRLVLWWIATHQPAKVVIIGPTHRQVSDIVWKETRFAYELASSRGIPFGGRMLHTPYWEMDDNTFVRGFATSDEYNIQGYHSPHLLAIVTEAQSVPQSHIDALKRLGPECLYMTGNAFGDAGEFYDSHHGKANQWTTIRIDADDTPNIKAGRIVIAGLIDQDTIDDLKLDWGEDSPLYQAAVHANWSAGVENAVVPLPWVRAAIDREQDTTRRGTPHLGVDVARFGDDLTVVTRRDGDAVSVLWETHGKDTQEIADWLEVYCADHEDRRGDIIIDDVGVGGGVTDACRRRGLSGWGIVAFQGGSKARRKERFFNLNAEVWWEMRNWLDPEKGSQAQLPDHATLRSQLAGRVYQVQGDRRIRLQSKEEMRKGGLRSPDFADSLAMTFIATGVPEGVAAVGTEAKESRWR